MERCRLCQLFAVLRHSHILPKWTYGRVRGDEAHPVMVNREVSLLTDRQLTEYMLCDDCEQRFSPWENYVSQLVAQDDGAFPWFEVPRRTDNRVADCSSLETNTIVLCAASVFWRASVSGLCSGMSLGTYEGEVRRFLLGEAPFPIHARLVVALFSEPSRPLPTARRIVTVPESKTHPGYDVHWFALCGVKFSLVVGRTLPPELEGTCFSTLRWAAVMPADDFLNEIGELALVSKAKGRLREQDAR